MKRLKCLFGKHDNFTIAEGITKEDDEGIPIGENQSLHVGIDECLICHRRVMWQDIRTCSPPNFDDGAYWKFEGIH